MEITTVILRDGDSVRAKYSVMRPGAEQIWYMEGAEVILSPSNIPVFFSKRPLSIELTFGI